ncbi:hypothetical protein DIPPA_10690 [Diplonema papillatum]|nr:hypothetical protein DIPPA_10690 [Diplonema papillatum]
MISYNPRDLDVIDLFPDDDLRASGGQPTLFERLLTSAADRAHLAREMPGYVPREGHRLKGTPWPLLLILATLPPGSEERQRAVKEAVAGVFERFSRPLPDRGSSAASLTSSSNELDMFRGDDAAGGAEALGLQEEAQYLLKALGGRSRRVTEKGAAAFVSKLLCRQLGVKLEADFGGGVVATRFRKIVAGDVGYLMNGGEFVDAKRLADYLAAIAKVWATSDDEKRVLPPLCEGARRRGARQAAEEEAEARRRRKPRRPSA